MKTKEEFLKGLINYAKSVHYSINIDKINKLNFAELVKLSEKIDLHKDLLLLNNSYKN
jgi:hypothetical protein